MLNLFYIHSHTTFLSALATIQKLNLANSELVFVTSRSYKPDTRLCSPPLVIDLSEEFAFLMTYKYKVRKALRKIKEIDSLIESKIGKEYTAFLPHIGVYLVQIIATHSLCKQVNFIEEGSASYSRRLQSKKGLFKGRVKNYISKVFFPTKRIWLTDVIFTDLYRQLEIGSTFGIFLKSFEFLPFKKEIINWQKLELKFDINPEYPIYIFDALIETNFINADSYWAAVKQMVSETASENNYIKFHPYQRQEYRKLIKECFEARKVQFIELNPDIIIEDILVNKRDLTFIGFSSSILLYAKIFKHRVKSYEGLLLNDKKYIGFRKLYDFEL